MDEEDDDIDDEEDHEEDHEEDDDIDDEEDDDIDPIDNIWCWCWSLLIHMNCPMIAPETWLWKKVSQSSDLCIHLIYWDFGGRRDCGSCATDNNIISSR